MALDPASLAELALKFPKVAKILAKWPTKQYRVAELRKQVEDYEAAASREEFKRYKHMLTSPRLRALVLQGVRLRRVAKGKGDVHALRNFILAKYNIDGLWVAEAVQLGVLDELDALLRKRGNLEKERNRQIEDFLTGIERRSIFVKEGEPQKRNEQRIRFRLDGESPIFLLVAGAGTAAKATAKALDVVRVDLPSYDVIPLPRDQVSAALFVLKYS